MVPFIDWSPFFRAWELHGRYPDILEDAVVGESARKLLEEAQTLLSQLVSDKSLRANGVYGFFPANSVGDDIELYTEESREHILTRFHTLRRQGEKSGDNANKALADYIAPKGSKLPDYLGAFAVTAGIGVEELSRKFKADLDDYNAIMVSALADRLAEAFAEYLHKQAREDCGYRTRRRNTCRSARSKRTRWRTTPSERGWPCRPSSAGCRPS